MSAGFTAAMKAVPLATQSELDGQHLAVEGRCNG
jgi:hypothetical protein